MSWKASHPKKDSGSLMSNGAVFAAVTLGQNQKEDFTTWADAIYPDVHILLAELCRQGYRLSVKYDMNNACMMSSITQQDDSHVHGNTIVTSRSDDPMEAILLSVYKVVEMFPDVPLPTKRESETWG